MSNGYRDYSVDDKAAALAWLSASGGNVRKASKELHMPRKTLEAWSKGNAASEEVGKLSQVKKKSLSELFEEVARLYLDRALDLGAVGDTRGKDAVIAAATATDKQLLLNGQPTQISKDVTDHSHQERAARILSLVKPARAA